MVGGWRGCWFLYIFVCVSCVSDEVLLRGGWLCHITLLKTHSQTQIGVGGVGGGICFFFILNIVFHVFPMRFCREGVGRVISPY